MNYKLQVNHIDSLCIFGNYIKELVLHLITKVTDTYIGYARGIFKQMYFNVTLMYILYNTFSGKIIHFCI